MADDDTRRSSLEEIKQMRARGLTKKTPDETLAFFRAGGKGHLTRMAKVLTAYARSHGARR
jgi:uncharacterized protein (DUF4415 family)